MIIIKLSGGLGNQMFQYALGKNSAIKNNTNLKLDLNYYPTQNLRTYELDIFNIDYEIATKEDISSFILPEKPTIISTIRHKVYRAFFNNEVIIEKQYAFDPSVLKVSSNAYIDGYWQSEKYFKSAESIIRESFQFKSPPDRKNQCFLKEMFNENSISIHIRRGDYVSNQKTKQIHGVCDLNYYNNAIDFITKKIGDPMFYIFSDDIEWSKHNMIIPFKHQFINNNSEHNYEDLRLISKCKHHIIANSTFSWWGAWLNVNPDKIVIAPTKWFNGATKDTCDLIPEGWIRM